eukprot:CAMPEP_0181257090 /NCGR_PEP_ID=MMETSP1096-20121128/50061_1 /TAXON_ID=156174 ORGANISM="Chrysochromulina ericina, Strain CCMP281" /NCGR_SAMPLE_ID=MMETSP1096 /ASSEMBLY_ACC=CAM_ASM_000453 /LENGTH=56 /DNA_ID=CAMNT_0023355389 /DNA_START=639 /DNA_END=812 /DNA_ORIENTATION=-
MSLCDKIADASVPESNEASCTRAIGSKMLKLLLLQERGPARSPGRLSVGFTVKFFG